MKTLLRRIREGGHVIAPLTRKTWRAVALIVCSARGAGPTFRASRVGAAAVIVLSLAIPGVAKADAQAGDFEAGIEAYKDGRLADAYAAWSKAGAADNPSAQYNLGLMRLRGIGRETDHIEAFRWFTKASKNGAALALLQLAGMFELGTGVPRDRATALVFLTAAVDSLPDGPCRDNASTRQQSLALELTPVDIARATDEARQITLAKPMEPLKALVPGSCLEDVILATTANEHEMPDSAIEKTDNDEPVPVWKSVSGEPSGITPVIRKSPDRVRPQGQFFAQVASYTKRDQAVRALLDFETRHADLIAAAGLLIEESSTPTLEKVFRVRVGPFESRPSAVSFCDALEERQQECFAVKGDGTSATRRVSPPEGAGS